MKIRELLASAKIARIDRELIAAHVLKKNRSWIIANDEKELDAGTASQMQELLRRRKRDEPLAYIVGQKEFYGAELLVTPDVLIPRPATEHLIEDVQLALAGTYPETHEIDAGISSYVMQLRKKTPEVIIDVGTGSGCIAILLALKGCTQEIIGVDTSKKALEVAEKNSKKFAVDHIRFVLGDGIEFVRSFKKPFLLVSNPPYIPAGTVLEKTVAEFEPHEALFAEEGS